MTTATVPPPSIGFRFWVYWMLATIGAGAAYVLIAGIVLDPLMVRFGPMSIDQRAPGEPQMALAFAAVFFASALMGAFFGAAQWLLLRKFLSRSGWWIIASFIGYGLPLSINQLDLIPRGEAARVVGPILMVLEFGLTLGVLQWLVLRGHVHQAGWWILFTLVGWTLAFGATFVTYITGIYVEPFDMISAFLAPVAVTGAGLVWLMRRTNLAGAMPGS